MFKQTVISNTKMATNKQESLNNSPKNRSREKQEGKKSLDSKRGIFTSHIDERKPHVNPYLNGQESMNLSKGNLNISSLDHSHQAIFRSKQYIKVNPPPHNIHTNYHMNANTTTIRQSRTPPPEVRFSYSSNTHESPIKYVPINAQQHQIPHENVQIKRTYIPHHIYNHIPIGNQNISQVQRPPPPASGQTHTDQAYNLLLREYEKIFSKFENQCKHTQELQQTILQLKSHKNDVHISQPQQQQHYPQAKDKKYSVNIQALHDQLFEYYRPEVDDIIAKRKQKCLQRLSEVFQSANQQINTTVIEESSTSYQWVS